MFYEKSFLLFLLILAILILVCALLVIINNNPIHSVLFLVLVFFFVAILFFLLQVEFIGIIFLMVYVGAISVLFLFVIMMLNVKITVINETILRYLPIGFIIGFLFLIEIILLLRSDLNFINFMDLLLLMDNGVLVLPFFDYIDWFSLTNVITNIESIGLLLYTYYFIYYLIGGLILLLAMIGSIVLTLNTPSLIKRQVIANQLYLQNYVGLVKYST